MTKGRRLANCVAGLRACPRNDDEKMWKLICEINQIAEEMLEEDNLFH